LPHAARGTKLGAVLKCDFCGREAAKVRRVALEPNYDRLTQRHSVRYACPECSERKSAERKDRERRKSSLDGSGNPL
jgi:predicted RNA-binding Zn-ribbon protein involved in translation (DUF1610 family)